jgi:hypothetical protein
LVRHRHVSGLDRGGLSTVGDARLLTQRNRIFPAGVAGVHVVAGALSSAAVSHRSVALVATVRLGRRRWRRGACRVSRSARYMPATLIALVALGAWLPYRIFASCRSRRRANGRLGSAAARRSLCERGRCARTQW